MFEFIRTHQRLMQFALLLFIFPSFAFVGIQSYSHFGDGDNAVAKVAGKTISKQEWEAATQQQMDQLRERFGAQFDPKVFDTPEARQRVLENLVAQRAMSAEVVRDHLAVSDQALQQAILSIPGMTTPEGQFDVERYKSILAVQGMTPAVYEVRKRQDMAMQQINAAVQDTAIAPKTIAGRISDLNDQERLVQELPFRNDTYLPQVKITDTMLKAYYDKNIKQFEVPEQVKAEYVVLSSETLASQIAVSDADVKSYYDQNQKRFGVEEQRRASHILVALKKDAGKADIAAAKAKAETLLGQVKAAPADFAKIARTSSDDPGSAERGGDLDLFGHGMMVKPFDDAVFKMKLGEISGPVQSDFGFHIIKLTEIKPASVKTLAEATSEITGEIRKQLAAKKYAESAEIFTNTAYEQADSLKPLADKLKLTIQTADNLKRVPNPESAAGSPINNPKFLAALFSNDALKNKHNTEAVEVAPSTLVVGHVVEYKPVSRLPLEAVQPLVKARVTQTEAASLARRSGEAKLAEMKKTPDGSAFGQEKAVSRTKENGIDPAAITALMKADASSLPALVGVDLPGKGYSIFRINKVMLPATLDAPRRTAEQKQIADLLAQEEMLAYIDVLKSRAQAKILPAATTARTAPVDDRPTDEAPAPAPAKPVR